MLEDYYTPNSVVSLHSTGGGTYHVKYTFTGITLNPGQTLPNTSGNVVGIRYTDWSNLDKANDHSNNLSATFALNANIAVFLGDGTQIYGNMPSDTSNPPQPPPVGADLGEFVVFSEEHTDLRDRVTITSGNIGSANYTEIGCDDTLQGDIIAKGTVFLRERACIYGNVTSGQSINKQNNVGISGTERSPAQTALPVLETPVVSHGTSSVSVPPGGSYTLTPGWYNAFHAYANATITVSPGAYFFREFVLEPNVALYLDVVSGERIDLHIKEQCSIGNGTVMTLPSGTTPVTAFSLRSSQTSQLYIGTDAVITGMFFAPDAEVHVYSRSSVRGMLYGKRVIVEPDVDLCSPPTLAGLSHSEGAMAPPFSPAVFSYVAVVPDATATLLVTPKTHPGDSVTVNGNDPSYPVNLTGTETDIVMLLTHPEACGTTEYRLKVKRSAENAIYVNQNNTGTKDGKTFETGYTDLQIALDSAAVKGMEVRIAEGTYHPTTLLDTTDARSATFIIKAGIEIKGGYNGTETGDTARGLATNTIFHGDRNGDDTAFASWPPDSSMEQYIDDNLYHVMTVVGDCRISDVLITHGNADGSGENAVGSAILVKAGTARLDYVGIVDHSADSGGAVFVSENGAIDTLKNVLFQNCTSLHGNGGGLTYLSTSPLVIDASVFDGNQTLDTSAARGGSAMYFRNTSMYLVNCVFAQNRSASAKGAVYNDGGTLQVLYCTFAFNTSEGAVSICNADSATATVWNSILWNKNDSLEVSGGGFTVNNTCITKGHAGSYNIAVDPQFITNFLIPPAGKDGEWGSYDDGLRLKETSPCINNAFYYSPPFVDILTTERPGYYFNDMGAYEYFTFSDTSQIALGYIVPSGQFYKDEPVTAFDTIRHWWHKSIYSASNLAYTAQVIIPKNKHTKKKSSIYTWLYSLNDDGSERSDLSPVKITLYKTADMGDHLLFHSQTPAGDGKPIIFVVETTYHGWYNNWSHVIATNNGYFKAITPSSQF